jgi:membrane protease YdiL (CAAX protease family)
MPASVRPRRRWLMLLGLPIWTLLGFAVAQLLVSGLLWLLVHSGVSLTRLNPAILDTVVAALVYVTTLLLVVGVPFWVKRDQTSRQEAGLSRLPDWRDFGTAPLAFIVYIILSGIFIYIVSLVVPTFDVTQAQEVGFTSLNRSYEYILAFLTLVVVAPLAEEAIFRGYLFGKLRKYVPIWVSVVITSLLFGALHLPAEHLQWNVAIDTFVLSVVLCSIRQMTGSIWAGVLVHMMKNGLAFYILFINPTLMHTIGG